MLNNILVGSAITAATVIVHKKCKLLKKLIHHMSHAKILDVEEFIKLISQTKNKPNPSNILIFVKGLLQAKPNQNDKNILSIITDLPIKKNNFVGDHSYDALSYMEILENTTWMRPQQLKDVSFNLKSLSTPSKISVQSFASTELSWALSTIKSFEIRYPQNKCKVLRILLKIYDSISRKKREIGSKIQYHGLIDGWFSIIGVEYPASSDISKGFFNCQSTVKWDEETKNLTINNPVLLVKQLSFVIKSLKKKYNHYKTLFIILAAIKIYLLIVALKWLYRKNKARIARKVGQIQQQVENGVECIICYAYPRNIIFFPCKHYGMCQQCFKNLPTNQCPVCKQQIESTVKVQKV